MTYKSWQGEEQVLIPLNGFIWINSDIVFAIKILLNASNLDFNLNSDRSLKVINIFALT